MYDVNERDFSNVPVMWEPKENSGKNMKNFMKRISEKYNVQINDYRDCHKWSIENVDKFWAEVWDISGIIYSKPYDKVIDLNTPMQEFQEWFVGARLNFAENLLKYRDNNVALILTGEDRDTEMVTYAELYEETKLYAAALRNHGVKKDDKVACFMSNRKEAVLAMLGAVSLGAIWLGSLPLMGSQAVINRFNQVNPKVLFTVDRFVHNHQEKDMLPKLVEISENIPSLKKIVIVPSKPESRCKDIKSIRNSCFLEEFLKSGKNADGSVPEIVFEQVPFTHPVFINYTSGTSGLPKAILHGSCSLLSVYRDYMLHTTTDRNTCWLSMSPVGWASWNLMSTMLFLGAKVLLFEGLPYFLSPTHIWDMVDEFKISHIIFTPPTLEEYERKKYLPTANHNLDSLKLIICGGSFVKPELYDFFYGKIKKDVLFSSMYGGTETAASFVLSCDETQKIYRGESPVPTLGLDVQIMSESGKSLFGEVGELVINSLTPNTPLGLWGDDERSVFKKSYYEKFPGKFTINDLAVFNPITRGFIVVGRSDETLKPKGCRFGSSEIYNIVDTFPEVYDSVCVSQYSKKGDERAVLFLKMKKGAQFNEDLVKKIQETISKELTYRHVPEVILETPAIPYNMNLKKVEIIVKKMINKMPYNPETVINPECLEYFKDVPELQGY